MNLNEKLAKIRKIAEVIEKGSKGYNYTYANEQDILAKITAGMEQYGVDVYPSIVPSTANILPIQYEKIKKLRDGTTLNEQINENIVSADMVYTWVNLDNVEEKLVVPWTMMGQASDASQAFGSGLTYCTRYFLLKFFKASTVADDPDSWRQKQQEAKDEEDVLLAKGITNQISELIKLNKTTENEAEVKKIIKKTVKDKGKPSVNYLLIKEPLVAQKVYDDLKELFEGEKKNVSDK